MHVVYSGQKNEAFPSFGVSLVSLFFFMFNVDPTSVVSPSLTLQLLGLGILIAFQMLIVIIFVNLIIAVMTNTYEVIMQNSKQEWLLQRAKFVVRIEDQLNFGVFTGPLRQSVGLEHQRIVVVVERADGMIEVRVPKVWIDDENAIHHDISTIKTTSPAYGSFFTVGDTPKPRKSFRTYQSSESIKDLRPGAMDVLVDVFHRFKPDRDEFKDLLQDPDVIFALTKLLKANNN